MESLYESAIKLKNEGRFDAARRLFETLLRAAENPEDQAYLLLHLFSCFKSLHRPQEALQALKRGYGIAPEGSRFSLDAGIEEAVWLSERGEYTAAIQKYQDMLDKLESLLSQPEEHSRLAFITEQLETLITLTEKSSSN